MDSWQVSRGRRVRELGGEFVELVHPELALLFES
jgi:hypothetical protein